MLVAALNPCPCGYRSDPRRACNCTPPQIEKYMGKISGPLLDRIDIHVEVPAAEFKELSSTKPGTSSETIREEVLRARKAQAERFAGTTILYNAQMTSQQIRKFCKLNDECMNLLKISVNELGLSARAARQSPASCPNHRRHGLLRQHPVSPSQRSHQLPHARPRCVEVTALNIPDFEGGGG